MNEIGGYIELDTYTGPMLHDDGIKLNCGRNALAYLIEAKSIHKIWMPRFMCDSCNRVLKDRNVEVAYYSIGMDFRPKIKNWDGWLYVVNFYGQLTNEYLSSLGKNVIVDNAQAYFQEPIPGIDTLYTCRKFFGVADGAILYTDKTIPVSQQDESFERMRFLLGRYERTASEFYQEYVDNNHYFESEPIKNMSRLTENLLHGIDYEFVRKRRTENFTFLQKNLGSINKLTLQIPDGAFMYPLYVDNGAQIRKELQKQKIYIPTLWPAVFGICGETELEYDMAKNILPLPCDQRYSMVAMFNAVKALLIELTKIGEFDDKREKTFDFGMYGG